MPPVSDHPGYSIAAVSKLTGVSCHALRVWERRYGFPVPDRSASGHRRYGRDQVAVLRQLAKLAHAGHSIGEVIGGYQDGMLKLQGDDAEPVEEQAASTPVVDFLFEGDVASAESILNHLAERLSMAELIEGVIEPALVDVGERWFRGEAQIYQERCATSALLARLMLMLERARSANPHPTRSVVIGAVQGDHHMGGVLMASLSLEMAGWRALPLGVDVPVEEFQKAAESWRPDALALSFVLSRNINKRFRELADIRGVPIFVGGRSIVNHQGLARRHGLIPLVGTLRACTSQLIIEVESLERNQARVDDPRG